MKYGLPLSALKKILTIFKRYPQIDKVVLYGSRAIGTYKLGSDIDLCIESETLSLSELFALENELDDLLLPWKIDLSLKNRIDNPALITHINEKGVLFYS